MKNLPFYNSNFKYVMKKRDYFCGFCLWFRCIWIPGPQLLEGTFFYWTFLIWLKNVFKEKKQLLQPLLRWSTLQHWSFKTDFIRRWEHKREFTQKSCVDGHVTVMWRRVLIFASPVESWITCSSKEAVPVSLSAHGVVPVPCSLSLVLLLTLTKDFWLLTGFHGNPFMWRKGICPAHSPITHYAHDSNATESRRRGVGGLRNPGIWWNFPGRLDQRQQVTGGFSWLTHLLWKSPTLTIRRRLYIWLWLYITYVRVNKVTWLHRKCDAHNIPHVAFLLHDQQQRLWGVFLSGFDPVFSVTYFFVYLNVAGLIQ